MNALETCSAENRVLLLAPTRKDAATTASLLQDAGIPLTSCLLLNELLGELSEGAGVVIVPEEAMTPMHNARLATRLCAQPAWSDLPILVLAHPGAGSPATTDSVNMLGNVTVLERPVRVPALLSAIRSALRARQRQYQIREYLAERVRIEESLRRVDQRKDEFLATLGHELRNPLAPLLSGMHVLRRLEGHDDRVTRTLASMERQMTQLVRLVDDLLELSRIARGLVHVRADALDLVDVVRAAVDTSRPAIDNAGHELTVDLPDTPIAVAGDAVRLTQVFTNLLTNAAKYTDERGRIHVTATQAAGRAFVSVRDSGIGIPPAQLEAVFDLFMQVDGSNRRAQGGLGIGLTLVRRLVEMHGGRVEARSAGIGQGSEFLIELPTMVGRRLESSTAPPPT
jgi:signal transduction histidine kinase